MLCFPLPKRTTRVYFGISAIGGVHANSGFGDKNSQHGPFLSVNILVYYEGILICPFRIVSFLLSL